MKFAPLHSHSFFSIGDSTSSPEENVIRAKSIGLDTISLTDHGTLAGWPDFKRVCTKHNIKPIFGIECYFVDSQTDIYRTNERIDEIKEKLEAQEKIKKPNDSEKRQLRRLKDRFEELDEERKKLRKYNHLILLAKNWQGASNIIKIHNAAVIDGTYYKPRADWDVLERFKGGIIATTACLGGRISKLIESDDMHAAKEAIARFKQIFGEGNFFLELQLNQIELQKTVNVGLIRLAQETNTPLCVTTDSHFAEEGGHVTRSLIRKLDKEGDSANNDDMLIDLYIKNDDMLLEAWRKYMPEVDANILRIAIDNTRKIADMVEIYPFDSTLKFPVFETGDLTAEDYLQKSAIEGLIAKGLHKNEVYVHRLQQELRTIEKLGFAQYFNVVADFVNYARKHQPVGIGRGCLTYDCPVYTLNGKKPLGEVRIGDTVIDHLGTARRVTNTMKYENAEALLEITATDGEPLKMTNDHKIWSSQAKDSVVFEWREAGSVQVGDWVWVPHCEVRNMRQMANIPGVCERAGGYAVRIKSIKSVPAEDVYDITVEETHSYLSDFAVHNSVGGSLLAYCVGITRVDPIRHELFFERFLDASKGLVAPTFGLHIAKMEVDYNKILDSCDCHKH